MQNKGTKANAFRKVLFFVLHQFLSTIGVIVLSATMVYAMSALLRLICPTPRASLLLTEVPGFPVQDVVGIVLGFLMYRAFRVRSALWVWLVPSLFLCLGMLVASDARTSIFSHFVGDACRPAEHCFDQVLFTLPFLTSAGYAIGAAIARKRTQTRPSCVPSTAL